MTRRSITPNLSATLAMMVVLLVACSSSDADRGSAEVDSKTPTPTEGSPTSPAPSPDGWIPVPTDMDGTLPPGRLGMTANGRPDAPWAVVEVPENFSTIDGWVLFDEDPRGGGGVGYWTVSGVVRDPCAAEDDIVGVGTTVEDLTASFLKQQGTRVTAPVPATVDGYRGLTLELHVPRDIDFAVCPTYDVWVSDPAGGRHLDCPGDFDRLWILDVEGSVVVLTVAAGPETPKSALVRLTNMVQSAEFVARE